MYGGWGGGGGGVGLRQTTTAHDVSGLHYTTGTSNSGPKKKFSGKELYLSMSGKVFSGSSAYNEVSGKLVDQSYLFSYLAAFGRLGEAS